MPINWSSYNASRSSSAPRQQQEIEKDPSFGSEVVRAIGTGAHGFVQSMAELPNIIPGIDYDVNIDPFGKAPQTGFGRFASTAIQFAVPYTGALKGLSIAARLGGLTRAAQTVKRTVPFRDIRDRARAPSTDLFKPLGAAPQRLRSTTSLTGTAPRLADNVVDDFIVKPGKSLTPAQRIAHYAGGGALADFVAFSPNDPNLSNMISDMTEDTRIPVINAISNLLATDEDDSDALNRFRNVLEGLGLGLAVPIILKGLSKGISKTGEGIANYIPESTKQKAQEWKTKRIDGALQRFASAGSRVKFIDDLLHQKSPLTPESKIRLGAYGKYRMLTNIGYRQEEMYNEGPKWLNPATGGMERVTSNRGGANQWVNPDIVERIPTKRLSMRDIEVLKRELGPENEELFGKYLYARQSEQLDRTTRGSQQAEEVYKAVLRQVEVLSPEIKNTFNRLVVHLQDLNDDWLELLRREGRMTAKEVENFAFVRDTSAMAPSIGGAERRIWVPQYRKDTDLDEELTSVINKGKGKNIRVSSKHKVASTKVKLDLKGVTDPKKIKALKAKHQADLKKHDELNPYNDPFANLEIGYHSMLESSMQNRFKLSLIDTVKDLGSAGKAFAIPTQKTIKRQQVSPDNLKSVLDKKIQCLKYLLGSMMLKVIQTLCGVTGKQSFGTLLTHFC